MKAPKVQLTWSFIVVFFQGAPLAKIDVNLQIKKGQIYMSESWSYSLLYSCAAEIRFKKQEQVTFWKGSTLSFISTNYPHVWINSKDGLMKTIVCLCSSSTAPSPGVQTTSSLIAQKWIYILSTRFRVPLIYFQCITTYFYPELYTAAIMLIPLWQGYWCQFPC